MQVYKRKLPNLLFSLVLAVCGAVAATVIAWFVLSFFPAVGGAVALFVPLGLGLLVLVGMVYSALFSENIRFELEADGAFRYFKRGTLQQSYQLAQCTVGYTQKSGRNMTTDLELKIVDETGHQHRIDGTPLGHAQFHYMFEAMAAHSPKEVEELEVMQAQ